MYNKKALNVSLGKFIKSNAYKDDIITDPRGQWAHPGQNTRIPSNQITMQGVPYPVWAVPNVGEPIMMQPYQDYTFPGAQYVDEYPQMQKGGFVTAGPEYDSRYGLIGKVGYQNDFKGRDRSTEHTLSGDVYGGAFGIGASGSYEFGTEQRGFPAKNFAKITVGGDKVRGAYGDLTAGSKIHAIQDRQNELNITPFGGVSMQTKASELAMPGADKMGSRVGLNYGLGVDYTKKFKNDSSLNLYGQMMGNPVLGKFTDRQSYDSEKLRFAPQFNVGAKFTLPLNSDSRKIKAIMAKQQEDKAKASPFALNLTTSHPSFQDGGEYEELELSDEEIQAYQANGYTVEELPIAQIGGPTQADSLQLYNNSRRVENYFTSKDYKPITHLYFRNPNVFNDLEYDRKDFIKLNSPGGLGSTTDKGSNGAVPLWQYHKNIDKNKFKQRENAYSILDTRSPMQLFDRRIQPTQFMDFSNNKKYDPLFGDNVGIHGYDPISVKPSHMLTDEELKLRFKRHGAAGIQPSRIKALGLDPNAKGSTPQKQKEKPITLPTRSLQQIPQDNIQKELIQRPKENMTGKVKTPQDAAQWIKNPQTGTWYQKQRPVRPEYLESRKVGFLQRGGVNPYYTSRFDDPRIQQYKDSAESWNRGSELYLNDPNQSWANSQADLDNDGVFHPLMPEGSLLESYIAALLPNSPSISFYKPKQKVIYNKPAKPMQLPTRSLQQTSRELVQQTFPETAPIKPMELAYRNQTHIDAEGNVSSVKVPYAAKDNGRWDLLDSPRVIDQRKQNGGEFIEMELTPAEIKQYKKNGYTIEYV
jgi:hypothetical protein